MKTLRFLKDDIVRRQTLLIAMAAFVLLMCAQVVVQQVYRDTLEKQVTQIEQSNLRIQSGSVQSSIKPYFDYLYSVATDTDILRSARPENGVISVRGRTDVRDRFKATILNVKNVLGLGLIYADGASVYYEKTDRLEDYWKDDNAPARRALFEEALGSRTPVSFIDTRVDDGKSRVCVAVPCIGSYLSRDETFAVAVIMLDLAFLENDFIGMDTSTASHYLVDASGHVLMCARDQLIGDLYEDVEPHGERLTLSRPVNTLGWTLYKRIDYPSLTRSVTRLSRQINALYIALAVLIVILSGFVSRHTLSPLRTLSAAMDDAGRGNLLSRVDIQGDNELWRTAENFNRMMARLQTYYEENERTYQRLLEAERRSRESEMAMLESHINAHFLFNTLNAINYQAIEAGNRGVSTSIKRLSNIMRYAFDRREAQVLLYQEAAWVEQYLYLNKERLGERLTYDISIDEDVEDWPFRKMMLQPFVENAITHGIREKADAVILLSARRTDPDHVLIVISDNGCGMTGETLETVRAILADPSAPWTGGIGLRNVAERIYAFFGRTAEITAESTPGKGVSFSLRLPWPEAERAQGGQINKNQEDHHEIY